MIDLRAFAHPEEAEMASARAAREAKDRRMKEAAIVEVLRRRIEGDDDPRARVLAEED